MSYIFCGTCSITSNILGDLVLGVQVWGTIKLVLHWVAQFCTPVSAPVPLLLIPIVLSYISICARFSLLWRAIILLPHLGAWLCAHVHKHAQPIFLPNVHPRIPHHDWILPTAFEIFVRIPHMPQSTKLVTTALISVMWYPLRIQLIYYKDLPDLLSTYVVMRSLIPQSLPLVMTGIPLMIHKYCGQWTCYLNNFAAYSSTTVKCLQSLKNCCFFCSHLPCPILWILPTLFSSPSWGAWQTFCCFLTSV